MNKGLLNLEKIQNRGKRKRLKKVEILIPLELLDQPMRKLLPNSKMQLFKKIMIKLLFHLLDPKDQLNKHTKKWDQSMYKSLLLIHGLKTKEVKSNWTVNNFNKNKSI